MDGTFATCPSLYCQLFTINGFINGQQFPLVYNFLPTKSRADNNRFFTIVKEEMQNQGLTFQPIAIMSDFELALLYLEGWHFRLNRLASKKHLNLFEVIELIKQEQAATEVQIIQLAGNGEPRPKKRKMQKRENKIKKLTSDFDNGHLTIESFISSLAHLVVSFS